MAKFSFSLLLILLFILSLLSSVEPSFASHPQQPRRSRARAYIEASCRTTRYPKLCVHCLSTYIKPNMTIQSPQQLAQVALSVSLYRAQYARAYVLKVAKELKELKAREYQVVHDCLNQINDGVAQLTESIKELRRLGQATVGDDLFWHISNVETWVSTALTDAYTCVDELPGKNMSKLKATIKGKVLNVAEVTSNALALFHRFAQRYRAAKKP
ncbi:unnamed protein product [Prunus armeniaca]|uniref:Pectinesterase inhibitor domain-containing protein n=1 Tax=Prunus armeniaca TaxID=36596 RepID=A0A6J5WJB9_PRUAR|nr:hypothetical protein GBA52_007665 [Prunus armeniaca]CAB4300077.1 unnamed protein product [Prunus armeniaca]